MMDIASFNTGKKAREGVKLNLKHPLSGEPLPFFVVIYGPSSPHHDRAIKVFEMKAGRKKAGDLTPKRIKAGYLVTKGWGTDEEGKETTILHEGVDLEFNEGNFTTLVKALPWILDDIDEACTSAELFLPDENTANKGGSGQKTSAKPQKQ